jgi:hypothetical protein
MRGLRGERVVGLVSSNIFAASQPVGTANRFATAFFAENFIPSAPSNTSRAHVEHGSCCLMSSGLCGALMRTTFGLVSW